jgi:hypothetical protein
VVYAWAVSLQMEEGPCKGCWMTDSVQPIDETMPFFDFPGLSE